MFFSEITQMQMIDRQISGFAGDEKADPIVGILEELASLAELKKMVKNLADLYEAGAGRDKIDNITRGLRQSLPEDDPVRSVVEKYLKDENIKPEAIIVLTDGFVPNWGSDWTAPIMWVISGGNTSAVAEHGKTIYLED